MTVSWPGYAELPAKGKRGDTAMKWHTRIYSNRGVDLAQRGDLKGAVRDFRAALAIFPQYLEVQTNLGLMLTKLGDLDGASRARDFAIVYVNGSSLP